METRSVSPGIDKLGNHLVDNCLYNQLTRWGLVRPYGKSWWSFLQVIACCLFDAYQLTGRMLILLSVKFLPINLSEIWIEIFKLSLS